MADIAESAPFTDPALAISQGKRHLLVRDYTMAVSALAQACQLLAEKHGDTADELGEPYLLYGRALLGLAREEAGVLGGGVPGTDENNEGDEDDDEEGDDDKLSNVDEKEEEEDEDAAANGESSETKTEGSTECKTDDTKKAEAEKSEDEKTKENKESTESAEKKDEANKTDDSKIAEQKAQESKSEEEAVAGSSKDLGSSNGPSCSSTQNGDVRQNGEDADEDDTKDDDDEEANNLQVAWEVLELAKLVLEKRGEAGLKLLADAYRLLGEVAMEGGNHQGALQDLQSCLELLQKMEPYDARAIAEIHYQLALAHSLGNEFDASIEQFKKATELLQGRITELEEMKEPPKTDDTFYTVEGEIKELQELLPEIQEKITDMKDFKEEACRLVIEGIKSKVAGGCSNGAGPSGADGSSSSKIQGPASDISHLVRKKRKAEEPETEVALPNKKPTPEKAV